MHFDYPLMPLIPSKTSQTHRNQPLNALSIPQNALKLSRKVDKYKPLPDGKPENKFGLDDVCMDKAYTMVGRCTFK
jgi:hypothetical protein